jgi:hypothetical protein
MYRWWMAFCGLPCFRFREEIIYREFFFAFSIWIDDGVCVCVCVCVVCACLTWKKHVGYMCPHACVCTCPYLFTHVIYTQRTLSDIYREKDIGVSTLLSPSPSLHVFSPVCLYVSILAHKCLYVCICIYVQMYVCVCKARYLYTCTYIHMYVRICVCARRRDIFTYVYCVCVCVCVCACMCTYVHTYMHT